MRIRQGQTTGVLVTLALLAGLAGCGHPQGLPWQAAQPGAALSPGGSPQARGLGAFADDDADLPLKEMPAQQIVVPDRPVRAPQQATTGNSAEIFVSPAEMLPALKKLINEAQESVYVEVFNFGNDSMGQQIVPLLIAKAKQGLEVKVVMDYIGSRFLKKHKDMVNAMRAAGVDVKVYKPRTIVKDDRQLGINITHRKSYMADGEKVLIGGMNLMAPFDTTTQDALILWRGPIVAHLYNEFAYDWHAAGGGALHQVPKPARKVGDVRAQVLVTSPAEGRYEFRDALYNALDRAKEDIMIENQYLWDDGLIDRLDAALKRGVRVRVMVPNNHHNKAFRNIHANELLRLTKLGAQARVYNGDTQDAHLHAKYYAIDGRWAALGSTNGDTRAYQDNQEIQVVFWDAETYGQLRLRLFEVDWALHSKPFVYKKPSLFTRPFHNLLELIDYYL